MRQIRELNTKQKQFCDEQVKLATGTYELVDKHVRQLDATLARFESELKDSKVFGGLQSSSPTTFTIPKLDSDGPLTQSLNASVSQPQASTSAARSGAQKQSATSGQKQKSAGASKKDEPASESKLKRKIILGADSTPKGSSNKRKRDDMPKVSMALPISHSMVSNGDPTALHVDSGPAATAASTSGNLSSITGNNAATSRLSVASLVRSIGGACGEVLDMPVDPAEPTYCICHQVSFGEMVACDNPECPVEWFHFACVGLTTNPRGKWFCPLCTRHASKTQKPPKSASAATPSAAAAAASASAAPRSDKKQKKRD